MDNFFIRERYHYDGKPSFVIVTVPKVKPFDGGEIAREMVMEEREINWDINTEEFISRFLRTEDEYYRKESRQPQHVIMNVKDYTQFVLFDAYKHRRQEPYNGRNSYVLPIIYRGTPITVVKEGDIQFVPHWSTLL